MTAPARRPVGRPSKLRPEVVERLLHAFRQGATHDAAAAYAGIHKATLQRWLAKAAATDETTESGSEFRHLRDQLDRARAELQQNVLASVMETIRGGALVRETIRTLPNGDTIEERQYAPPDGKLGLELLSRLWRADFGRTQQVELSGPGGGPLGVPVERLQAIAGIVHQALASGGPIEDAEIVDEQPRMAA